MTAPMTAEQIAAKLTAAQRRTIRNAEEIVIGEWSVNCADDMLCELALEGIVNDIEGDALTPPSASPCAQSSPRPPPMREGHIQALKRLRAREDLADLHAMAFDFGTAVTICREVSAGLRELFGQMDPMHLRERARQILGEWR